MPTRQTLPFLSGPNLPRPARHRLHLLLAIATTVAAAPLHATTPSGGEPADAPVPLGTPLSLDQAIHDALAANFALEVASFDPQIASETLRASWGAFDPVLEFSLERARERPALAASEAGSGGIGAEYRQDAWQVGIRGLLPSGTEWRAYGRDDNQRNTFNAFADTHLAFAGVEVRQPLLRGLSPSSNLLGVRIARTDARRSEWEYRQAAIDLVTDVVTAFNEVHFAAENLRVATQSRELALGLLDENERRRRIGTMSDYDVTVARARAARRDEAVLLATRFLRDAENALRQLTGRALITSDAPLPLAPPPAAPDLAPDPAAALQPALDARPDFQAARLGRTLASQRADAAANAFLPRLDLVGRYGWSGIGPDASDARDQVSDRDYASWSVAAVVEVPLSFTTERGRLRAARLAERRASTDLLRLEQEISLRLTASAGALATARERIAATERARSLAAESLLAEQRKLRAGTSNTLFVLDLQEILADAEIREVRARIDYNRAVAAWERETGVTLASRGIALAEP